ncbi:hypothetical protein PpBr36_02508 [Pyricularia pennisetigena]|uniref:hypothetical protein n=1 Tax=Pyricularia pennisetigena TaxID=1578925 RepID=UPI0011545569|nr:hypothetical protein PpBr36_02508 [Pyricularia pennisetigena]TLS30640.1 hypothetical protein PpBr36_02508 [Pyricularia pennisetigena]
MAPFYFYNNFMPGCEACFSSAGRGGCRVVKANGEATFVCQSCRDTIANIIFLVPDVAAATALVNNGFCQFCFSKPSAGICCNECAVRTPDELEFVARKGTILVLLANALQQPGAREQMLEPILNADNGGVIPVVASPAVVGGGEQLHFDPAMPAREWQNMPGDAEFGLYPNQDFQFGNQAHVPAANADVPKVEPMDYVNGVGHPHIPIPAPPVNQPFNPPINPPANPILPQVVMSASAQNGEVNSSSNATPTSTAGRSLASRILGVPAERVDSLDPQPAQQPPGHDSTDEEPMNNSEQD